MCKYLLCFAVLVSFSLSACSEQQFAKSLNNVWSSGAGNAAGAPVFSAEAEGNQQKKKEQASTTKSK